MDRTLNADSRLRLLLWVLSCTLLISGSAIIAHTLYQTIQTEKERSSAYGIGAIVQPEERLPADEIAALLGLSSDYPTNLYTFDLKRGEQALLSFPRIRTAKVKRSPPDALYVDLTLRDPIALTSPGMALDEEGACFPYHGPFNGPTIRLGGKGAREVLEILEALPGLSSIDATRIDHPRYGLREIVIELQGGQILRLPSQEYQEAIACYHKIKNRVEGFRVIDLRLPHLAYLKAEES